MKDKEEMCKLMVESGKVCIGFSTFHKYAEDLLGVPIYTHEFGMKSTNLNLKIAQVLKDEGYRYTFYRNNPLFTLKKLLEGEP